MNKMMLILALSAAVALSSCSTTPGHVRLQDVDNVVETPLS